MSAEGFEKVVEASEVPPGTVKVYKVGAVDIFIANIEGTFFAHPNKCTHAGGPVGKGKFVGSTIQCPWHGSKFDVKTGAVVGPPARVPLPSYEVKVESTGVWIKKS